MIGHRSLNLANAIQRATKVSRALDPFLCNLARKRAIESITTPGHRDLTELEGKVGWGEVLGWRRFDSTPIPETVAAWMASPTHWAVIRDPAYRAIGTAVVVRGDNAYLCAICTTELP